jgi:hypothetical protein
MEGLRLADVRRRREVEALSADEKLRQISRLMASAKLFDMSRRNAGDQAVRELWQELRARWPDNR